jgi:hypothetical protein
MTRLGLFGVFLLAVVTAACAPVRADEVEVSVSGEVIAPAGQPTMVCWFVLTSLPPQCGSGIEVRGLDVSALPGSRTREDVTFTEGQVELIGTLDTTEFILTVTEPPTPVSVGEPGPSREPPCDEPTGGWPPFLISNADVHTIRDYGKRFPDSWSGAWTDTQRQVWTVAFTGDLSAHEAALAELYDGPICVIRAEHTRAELDAIDTAIEAMSVEPSEHGPAVQAARVDEVSNRVRVVLWLADEVALAPLGEFDDDMVGVSGWIELLD